MKASIIVICHNSPSICTCIDEILSQMDLEDELIILDDHSDAEKRKELDRYYHQDIITIIDVSPPNGNRPLNRNQGAARANGELLIFMDGDVRLSPNMLSATKKAFTEKIVGVFTYTYAMGYNENQLNFILGEPSLPYILTHTAEEIRKLPILNDHRSQYSLDTLNGPYNWSYYYSTYCAMTRAAFMKTGGFDTYFEKWGCEDIEIGYQLAKIGKIKFLDCPGNVHLPHKRNFYNEQLSNRYNMYYMLKKHEDYLIEVLISYGNSSLAMDIINKIIDELKEIGLPLLKKSKVQSAIYYDMYSKNNPTGTITYFDSLSQKCHIHNFGLALPFPTDYFETAELSEAILLLPQKLAVRILQEYCRIARSTIIRKLPERLNLPWSKSIEDFFQRNLSSSRYVYFSKDFLDFNFETEDGFYRIEYLREKEHITWTKETLM